LLESGKGGSVAGAAFSPCGTIESYPLLIREVMKNIFRQNERILGKAIFAAKCSVIARYPTDDYYYGPAVLYTLFGDPALRIKMPLPTATSEAPTTRPTGGLRLTPNPTRGSAVVSYQLTEPALMNLRIYDARGALVRIVAEERQPAGSHSIGLVRLGLPVGVYFVNLSAVPRTGPEFLTTCKLVIEEK
jgi:hypothetical protein